MWYEKWLGMVIVSSALDLAPHGAWLVFGHGWSPVPFPLFIYQADNQTVKHKVSGQEYHHNTSGQTDVIQDGLTQEVLQQ